MDEALQYFTIKGQNLSMSVSKEILKMDNRNLGGRDLALVDEALHYFIIKGQDPSLFVSKEILKMDNRESW